MSYGDGDPGIPAQAAECHQKAQAAGQNTYLDPSTGYAVMTAASLREEAACCGNACRHCPYGAAEQARAGRSSVRPG